MRFFQKKKAEEPLEALEARAEVEKSLSQNLKKAAEASRIAARLSDSRKANHYAERIRSAYHLETR